jgi:hypothetical protein
MVMRKVFAACGDKWRVPVAAMTFKFDGARIKPEDTAELVGHRAGGVGRC